MHHLTAQEAETIARLATKAREEGVRLYRDRRDGRHYATSATTPGKLYFVTLASCTCMGFISHGHCKHHAALTLAVLNEPEDNEPDEAPVPEAPTVDTSAFRPVVEVVHIDGFYEDAGWLVRSGEPVWHETETQILVDGQVWVTVIGDFNCRARHWAEGDMTECMPSGLDHYAAVEEWIKSATNEPAWEILQRANMMPLEEALDELLIAA
jgi:hypothetical protein